MNADQKRATIQDVVDAIDHQTDILKRVLDVLRGSDAPLTVTVAPVAPVQPSEAPEHPPTSADAPEPAQTLADLTPCLGDRVRARDTRENEGEFTYVWHNGFSEYVWSKGVGCAVADAWTVLEHLDPVTPEEPPVGSGVLVDTGGDLWRRDEDGWKFRASQWSLVTFMWDDLHDGYGPLRPATPADLARHGVGEDGEPVGKGEPGEDVMVELPWRAARMALLGLRKAGRDDCRCATCADLESALERVGVTVETDCC